MKIAFANDHAATAVRSRLIDHIRQQGLEVLDFGTDTTEPVDYPDQAEKAVEAVLDGRADRAILVCGSGVGISIAANKFPGIRCALCTDEYAARMGRAHNNANVLALRAREAGSEPYEEIINAFLKVEFEGGRHQRRLDKITRIENKIKES